jgi:serine/threonine-protein kinase HipA
MNRIEKSIIASFSNVSEQSFSEIVAHTNIPKGTVKKYLLILVKKNMLDAIGEGRGRYYKKTNNAKINQIAVFKSATLIGFLEHEVGRYVFEYDKGYKGKKLDGLTEDGRITSVELFPIFENLIPESDRRNAYLDEDKNLVEILLELNNTHGDFDFVSADKLYEYTSDYTQRKNWLLVKEKILQKQEFVNILNFTIDIEKEILEEKGKHSSLSGYQNKIDVNIDFKNKRISQSHDALYLLKPYNAESAIYNFKDKNQTHLPFMGLNEHLFMSFAKNAYGFDVPWSGIIAGEKDFHYVVKRYDRYDGYKYEQRDFAQIMNIKSDQKYFTTSEKLFDTISETIKSKEERVKFLEFYFFSFIIEHADLHIKNISILNIGKDKQKLSPLYDLISNGVYRGDSDELGLALGGKKKNISLESFHQLAKRIDISKLQSKKIAKRMIAIFIEEFPRYIDISSQIKLFDNLKVQKNRVTFGTFSNDLQKFYERRIESLRQRGILEELGL